MAQDQEADDNSTVYTLLFAALLVIGAVAGTSMAVRVVPDSHAVAIIGLMMLPLGVIIGLSLGQGITPPTSVLNLMSVFQGRQTIAEVNSTGGAMSLAIWTAVGTLIVAIGMAFMVDVFVKPEIPFSELAKWFGGTGLVYGLVVGAALFFMTE